MKKKDKAKKILAVVLSIVIIAMSIPYMLLGSAAGGAYDPAPYFDDAAREEGARAWVDEDGNVHVAFPSAIAQPTFKGEPLQIEYYILELTNMGAKNTEHTKEVLDTIKVPAGLTRARSNYAMFEASGLKAPVDLDTNRYNVEITAVDTEKWFSQSLHTTVTDVPEAQIDSDNIVALSTSTTAAREIMTFDGDSNSKDDWTNDVGDELIYKGVVSQAGTPNATHTADTDALGFVMYNQPSSLQIFETSWSRQTWDFNGAEEMWVWMDLEDVELEGLAFRIRTNEKLWEEWNNDKKTLDQTNRVGDMVYSTRGTAAATYTGEDPYVYVQQADGTWKKTMLNDDGTLDIGNMVGYVRVPLKFICSETDQYVDNSNQEIACGYNYKSGNSVNTSAVESWITGTMTFTGDSGKGILVDPAGTSIQDALLIHRRSYLSASGFLSAGDRHRYSWNAAGFTHTTCGYTSGTPDVDYAKVGHMLAIPLDTNGESAANDVKTGEVSTDRAYIAGGAVQNRAGGLKAIQDVWSMGFSLEGGKTGNTLKEDFYIDNMFFYRTDGGAYPENTLDGNVNTGNSVAEYYDEEMEVAKIIFKEINKYIENPNWANYREVEYILSFIQQYKEAYELKGKITTFLGVSAPGSGTGLAACSAAIGDTAWGKFWEAYQECLAEGTLATANAESNELVPLLVNTLEKMPKAKDIKSVSNILRLEIIKVWRAYSLLNLGQLDMLGAAEEEEILDLIGLLNNFNDGTGDKFVVGQALADYPYIIFNDFEDRTVGEQGWKAENDSNSYTTAVAGGTGNILADWRHTKGITTYSTNGDTNITDKDYYGYDVSDKHALDNKVLGDAAYAEITNKGYLNSKGATVNISNTSTASNQSGVFHTITFSRDAKDSATFDEMRANNTGIDGLGNYASNLKTGNPAFLVSLILYVDFSEIDNFYFTTNIFTKDADGNNVKARPNMGIGSANENWVYSILDPATGEWRDIHTTSQYCFNSSANAEYDADLGFNLNNYRGYIKIPLYHVKYYASIVSEPKLDENETYLNNIYAIQFAVGGGSSLYGKSFTIDNVGFTFDDSAFDNAPKVNKSYAELFNAKSTPAYEFEEEVAAIDIYDETTRDAAVNAALDSYRALPEHQKKMVADTYKILYDYQEIILGHKVSPVPEVTPDELNTYIASLPEAARNASVSGYDEVTGAYYDLTYPGFIEDADGKDAVNYGGYGLDAAKAQEIIDYYNNSYAYYSKSEKTQVNTTEFINAYKAAMRTHDSLANIKADVDAVAPEISKLYTPEDDENGDRISSFVKITEREKVQNFYDSMYAPMRYYAKTSLANGQLQKVYRNASRGMTYFLKNTDTYNIDGEEINGGIINFRDKMQAIYENALNKITNKQLFEPEEIQEIKDIIEEYNNFLPAYYNVKELYDLEQLILGLFPTISVVAPDNTDILLSEDKLTGDPSTFKVTYSEILDLDDNGDKYYVKITSKNGAMVNTYGDRVEYNLDISGSATNSATIVETGSTPFLSDIANNQYTEASPLDYVITPSLTEKPTGLSGMVEDSLTIQVMYVENVTTTDENGVESTTTTETQVGNDYIITVSYSMGDAYKVSIPASFPVEWDSTEAVDVSYSVTTEMVATSKLFVGVTDDGTGKLTCSDPNYTLNYTTENFKELEYGNRVTDAKPAEADTPKVTVSGWDAVPVGEYKTQLTYTVTYDNGSS